MATWLFTEPKTLGHINDQFKFILQCRCMCKYFVTVYIHNDYQIPMPGNNPIGQCSPPPSTRQTETLDIEII